MQMPNYEEYNREEIEQTLKYIDKDSYPERAEKLAEELQKRIEQEALEEAEATRIQQEQAQMAPSHQVKSKKGYGYCSYYWL